MQELMDKIKNKFEKLKRYVTNIGKAQQATIKMAMEFTDLLRKVDYVGRNAHILFRFCQLS